MRAANPYVEVPGDTSDRIMARSANCVGMSKELAVWRFGFSAGSDMAEAFEVAVDADLKGFLWVIATRKTGRIKQEFRGYAMELPNNFKRVIEWEP